MPKKTKLGAPEPFHLINRIPIRDNGEPLVDLRGRREARFLNLAPGCLPFVRESVLARLIRAQARLPWYVHIQISTALRTLDMQSRMYWSNFNRIQSEHPQWPLSAVRRACNKFFAPPDAKAPPGHCTGGAVDVALVDLTGRPLDVTSPFLRWDAAYTFVDGLTPEAHANRKMLYEAMTGAGFSNCRDEWWHYSYGDSAWAVRTGNPIACYGLIPPPASYSHVPKRPARPPRKPAAYLRPGRWRRRKR
ncbi:MAG: M15 family metallopeptidase [Capsulimonadaceae bacterium]|nr:M15 family metallopeptidase [Capsulimonadaceae bacterium]